MTQQLAGELKGTMLKLLDQKVFGDSGRFDEVKREILDIQPADSISSVQEELQAVVGELCGMVENRRSDLHRQTVEEIKRFIGECYSDSELTLYRIAERVEKPEKTVSQLFKEVTGVNLSDYLEKIRMERAEGMLRESEHTIDDIASSVGYNSSHSFRRAFKRVVGVSPSAYRKTYGG